MGNSQADNNFTLNQKQMIDTSCIILSPVRVVYLRMNQVPIFTMPEREHIKFMLRRRPISVRQYRDWYYGVGKFWNWVDRLLISDEELLSLINAHDTEIFIMQVNGRQAGFAEFVIKDDHVEIQYFGLFPEFIGKGLGKYFLYWVINRAWSYKPKWIQLNTCELDHHNALGVYRSMGFMVERISIEMRKVLPIE